MKLNSSTALQKFQSHFVVPFQLYNSLFISLPFNRIEKKGILLSLFLKSSINESIVDSHTLIPDALFHAYSTFSSLMSPDLPLERRQHEMIATMVSVTNDCFYWLESHAEFLRRVTFDIDLIAVLREEYKLAPITEAERVMCDYVVQLTKDATKIYPAHHKKLRAVGFDDQAILQITLIASWFNYINRVADALGVGRDWIPTRYSAKFLNLFGSLGKILCINFVNAFSLKVGFYFNL